MISASTAAMRSGGPLTDITPQQAAYTECVAAIEHAQGLLKVAGDHNAITALRRHIEYLESRNLPVARIEETPEV